MLIQAMTGDHEDQAPHAADPRQVASERHPVGDAVMAQHYAGAADRQARGGVARVRQTLRIGEQPESRQARYRLAAPPGEESLIHQSAYLR